jgi:hypothetical protein
MKTKGLIVLASLVVFGLVCSFWTPTASGQAVYGSIFGTVTDPSGAAVPNAKVTVSNTRKGTSDTTTTNEAGNYSATHLIPDTYSVRIEAPGFKVIEQKNVSVSADMSARVDGQFQLGSATEAVEVTAEAPQLKTDRADVAVQFNEKYVSDLPILNRNFTTLELLSPGTQKLVGWSHAATENPQGSQQIFVNGQHFSGTAYELDGTDNQDPILGIIVVNPNLDAVTESKVALQNYDAEFGKAIAGVVTAQTKSGSNDLHGSAFWFRRTDATQARDPFSQFQPDSVTGRLIPSSRWNQFGGSLGGPIIKNKLFFFGDYQGTRQTNGITQVLSVPTDTVLTSCNPATNTTGFCDLSEYLAPGAISGGGQVYDPATGNQLDGTGRSLFVNNQIPIGQISQEAAAILALFPSPNAPGTNNGVKNNFVGAGSGPFNQNSFDTRIDYSATESLQVFGRFSLDYFNLSGKGALGPLGGVGFGLGGLTGSSVTHNYSLATGFTKTLSSSLLTDFRFGWFKYNPQTHKADEGANPMDSFGPNGIPNMNLGDVTTSGLAAFFMDSDQSISDFGDGLNVGRCNCPLTESEQQVQFVNNWTKIVGNHQYKFGGDARYALNLRLPSDANRTGQLNFNHKNTSDAGAGGLSLATFLLGNVTFMDRYVSGSLDAAERQKRFFFYGQDTWRLTPKLTLNYGLRWEIYFPESVNGKGKGGFANIEQGVIRVAGYGPFGTNGNIDNTWNAFAPRIGIAYQFNSKTVLRLGYGRSYDLGVFGSNFGHTVTQNLPVLVNQNVNASNNVNPSASNDTIAAFTLAQGPPLFDFSTIAIPSNGILPLQGPNNNVSPKIRPTSQVLPTLDAWNATLQRQLTNTLSLEVAYVASKGSHVFAGNGPAYNVNQIAIGPGTNLVICPPPNAPDANPCPVALALGGFKAATAQNLRRRFHNAFSTDYFGNTVVCCDGDLGNYLGNDASSNYNALQIKVEKRFSQGLQFLSHYTWSHANNYTDDYYADDPRIAYGPDDFNRNHVWVTNVVYELPFGKGKMFGANASRAMDLIIGGWQLNSTSNWSSGLPWTPSLSKCGLVSDAGPCRPDTASGSFQIGAGSFDPQTRIVQFFTPIATLGYGDPNAIPEGTDTCTLPRPSASGFALPACGTIGNLGRNVFHGPGLFTSDLSVMKNFQVTERLKAQFRMDAFNVFNHPVLGFSSTQGNTCVDCAGAGQITSLEQDTSMRQLQFAIRLTF